MERNGVPKRGRTPMTINQAIRILDPATTAEALGDD